MKVNPIKLRLSKSADDKVVWSAIDGDIIIRLDKRNSHPFDYPKQFLEVKENSPSEPIGLKPGAEEGLVEGFTIAWSKISDTTLSRILRKTEGQEDIEDVKNHHADVEIGP
jgi:hypothetical protein